MARWRARQALRDAAAMDFAARTPWPAAGYALGVGFVLAGTLAVAGPSWAIIAASGAVNAGVVGLTSHLNRPRAVMAVSLPFLGVATGLGSLTAATPTWSVLTAVALGAGAGLLAGVGPGATTLGTQVLVGFVTLGRDPGGLAMATVIAAVVMAGGAVQILIAAAMRADRLHARTGSLTGRASPPPNARCWASTSEQELRETDVLRAVAHSLRRPNRAIRWHALRMATCVGIAQVVALSLPDQHAYWVALTAFTVLKPDWAPTVGRSIDRWIGTLLGATVIGLLTTAVTFTGVWLVLAVTVLIWAAFAVERVSYLLHTAGLAAYIVVFLQVIDTPAGDAVWDRALATTTGGLLALAAATLIRDRPPTT